MPGRHGAGMVVSFVAIIAVFLGPNAVVGWPESIGIEGNAFFPRDWNSSQGCSVVFGWPMPDYQNRDFADTSRSVRFGTTSLKRSLGGGSSVASLHADAYFLDMLWQGTKPFGKECAVPIRGGIGLTYFDADGSIMENGRPDTVTFSSWADVHLILEAGVQWAIPQSTFTVGGNAGYRWSVFEGYTWSTSADLKHDRFEWLGGGSMDGVCVDLYLRYQF